MKPRLYAAFSAILGIAAAGLAGCERKPSGPPAATQPVSPAAATPTAALLVGQAQFLTVRDADGQSRAAPGPARLVILREEGDTWTPEVLEDPDGNVFHKAMPFDVPGEAPGILTISANEAPKPAILKVWRDGKAEEIARAAFGGRFNRFRDVEIGDVTGDGKPELVIATHDQGVVLVVERRDGGWHATEIDRAPDTFVHEIELGDVDGDGRKEIYATPSEPNVTGGGQSGHIVVYRHDQGKFARAVVEDFRGRHVKEILCADVDGSKRPVLFAAVELGLAEGEPATAAANGVYIRRYRFESGAYVGHTIASLPDRQCRFLNAGDVDGDGRVEIVASAYKSGVWLLRPRGDEWAVELIDDASSGYEHATTLADFDGDGTPEIYVAADDQQAIRRYRWDGERFERTRLAPLRRTDITFSLVGCTDARCLPGR